MILNATWDVVNLTVGDAYLRGVEALAEEMYQHRKNATSRRALKVGHDIFGIIGEDALESYFKQQQLEYERSEWDPAAAGDEFDFRVGSDKIDVKTRETKWNNVDLMDYEVILDDPAAGHGNQFKKPMDFYVFALYRSKIQRVTLLGWSTKQLFVEAPSFRRVEPGGNLWGTVTANQACLLSKLRDLNPMRDLIEVLR